MMVTPLALTGKQGKLFLIKQKLCEHFMDIHYHRLLINWFPDLLSRYLADIRAKYF